MGKLSLGMLVVLGLLPATPHVPAACGNNRVEGGFLPENFHFEILVPLRNPSKPGGWRAACVSIKMANENTDTSVMCQFEVGTPLRTEPLGPISDRLAQCVAAEQSNEAAYAVLSRALMPGMACQEFKHLFDERMRAAIEGSRVRTECDVRLEPVIITALSP